MSDIIQDIYQRYKIWIINNPQKIGDYETLAKWTSYFIAGRINNSILVSELVYSLSNLVVLFNDIILTRGDIIDSYNTKDKIKIYLTVIEYMEVFLELSSQKLWKSKGKWLTITVIQLSKCITKLLLVHHYKEPLTQCPTIMPLNRLQIENVKRNEMVANDEHQQNMTFTLKRSGKAIRRVAASPAMRDWKPVQEHSVIRQSVDSSVANQQLVAETIYIVKPLLHLFASKCFGINTWKPWMISLVLDVISLKLYSNSRQTKSTCLTRKQNLQLTKRYLNLLLYILRSPFYEKYTQEKLKATLNTVGNKVPLANLLTTPLQKYIPFWQSNYFYMWSY